MRQYAALSGSYDGLMHDANYAARTKFLCARLRESRIPVETVLDLGCGAGTVAWGLWRHGFRVIACDNSEEMLTEAVRKGDDLRRAQDDEKAVREGDDLRHVQDGAEKAVRKGDDLRRAQDDAEKAVRKGDASEADAVRKGDNLKPSGDVAPPLFVCQSMPRLKLASPVDGVVSTLDSLNYLTRERDIRETFRRVRRYLRPGGRFLFDVNTPYRLRGMDRQLFCDETEESFCAWRTFFSEKTQVCVWQVDLFRLRPDGAWERSYEEHRERAWSAERLREFLQDAGFSRVEITGDLSGKPPKDDENRWNVLAE